VFGDFLQACAVTSACFAEVDFQRQPGSDQSLDFDA
jgi:hypothetical protein